LQTLHDSTSEIIKATGMSVERETYLQIVIVAHSLGAVVTRYALNAGHEDKQKWLDKCKLVLFAPAHIGAQRELKSFVDFPGPIKCLGPFIRYFVLTFNQLVDPTIIIKPMTDKCNDLIEKEGIQTFTIAKKVIWASPERVVINDFFLKDPKPLIFQKKGHSAVCKPTRSFIKPIEELKAVL
jgi:hypothetical protein